MPAKKLTKLRAFLMEHLWAPRAARSLRATIARVKPDCVWVIPHDWSILPLGRVMCSEWRVAGPKPRIHVTIQDFPDCHGHGEAWGHQRVRRLAQLQEQIYARADTADATSLPMLEELERRTGKRGLQMIHQGLEPQDFQYLESLVAMHGTPGDSPPATRHSPPIRIAYAGTVLVDEGFTILVRALERLRESDGLEVVLDFFAAHRYVKKPWFRAAWMREHGHLGDRKLLDALRQCHLGFIPMHLQDHDPRYNRFSFPTKFITYLAAGLPIIAFGHPESSVIKMAGGYRVGLCWQGGEEAVLEEGLRHLLREPYRERWAAELLRCAREQFDAEKMRRRLWEAFGLSNT
jgi:glycosyltransferase involved in cell wall biosynthesis